MTIPWIWAMYASFDHGTYTNGALLSLLGKNGLWCTTIKYNGTLVFQHANGAERIFIFFQQNLGWNQQRLGFQQTFGCNKLGIQKTGDLKRRSGISHQQNLQSFMKWTLHKGQEQPIWHVTMCEHLSWSVLFPQVMTFMSKVFLNMPRFLYRKHKIHRCRKWDALRRLMLSASAGDKLIAILSQQGPLIPREHWCEH